MNRQMSLRAEPAELTRLSYRRLASQAPTTTHSTRLPPGLGEELPQLAASFEAPEIAAELPTAQRVVSAHPPLLSANAPVAPKLARAPEPGPGAAPSPRSTDFSPTLAMSACMITNPA